MYVVAARVERPEASADLSCYLANAPSTLHCSILIPRPSAPGKSNQLPGPSTDNCVA